MADTSCSLTLPSDYVWAPLLEGALILAVGGCAWAAGQPWIFSSLGPTAYEQAEKPELKSARFYNVIVGHYVGLGAGFFSLWVLGAWSAPHIVSTSSVSAPRLWASIIAVVLTTLVNLLLGSGQPAALSTTLLVTSGGFQNARGALSVAIAVAMLAVIGEPVRRLRLRNKQRNQQRAEQQEPSPQAT